MLRLGSFPLREGKMLRVAAVLIYRVYGRNRLSFDPDVD